MGMSSVGSIALNCIQMNTTWIWTIRPLQYVLIFMKYWLPQHPAQFMQYVNTIWWGQSLQRGQWPLDHQGVTQWSPACCYGRPCHITPVNTLSLLREERWTCQEEGNNQTYCPLIRSLLPRCWTQAVGFRLTSILQSTMRKEERYSACWGDTGTWWHWRVLCSRPCFMGQWRKVTLFRSRTHRWVHSRRC